MIRIDKDIVLKWSLELLTWKQRVLGEGSLWEVGRTSDQESEHQHRKRSSWGSCWRTWWWWTWWCWQRWTEEPTMETIWWTEDVAEEEKVWGLKDGRLFGCQLVDEEDWGFLWPFLRIVCLEEDWWWFGVKVVKVSGENLGKLYRENKWFSIVPFACYSSNEKDSIFFYF